MAPVIAQHPLFPPFLDAGSYGSAVRFLQQLLCSMGYTVHWRVIGGHDSASVEMVKQLQRDLGFAGDDVDGNFGPGTRAALKEQKGIDIDAIPAHAAHKTYWFGPENIDGSRWV